eukprot:GHVR01117027.1.p1 GENE.GHVR01117027.1~~GHVR01117027.1.p1  ORF type:complete len:176 (-),score=37.26 GHVR01117027.1:202-729(-)
MTYEDINIIDEYNLNVNILNKQISIIPTPILLLTAIDDHSSCISFGQALTEWISLIQNDRPNNIPPPFIQNTTLKKVLLYFEETVCIVNGTNICEFTGTHICLCNQRNTIRPPVVSWLFCTNPVQQVIKERPILSSVFHHIVQFPPTLQTMFKAAHNIITLSDPNRSNHRGTTPT